MVGTGTGSYSIQIFVEYSTVEYLSTWIFSNTDNIGESYVRTYITVHTACTARTARTARTALYSTVCRYETTYCRCALGSTWYSPVAKR